MDADHSSSVAGSKMNDSVKSAVASPGKVALASVRVYEIGEARVGVGINRANSNTSSMASVDELARREKGPDHLIASSSRPHFRGLAVSSVRPRCTPAPRDSHPPVNRPQVTTSSGIN